MSWSVTTLPEAQFLRAPSGGFYDVNTLLSCYGDGPRDGSQPDFVDHWRTYHHERSHFLQHVATTTGAFLGLLRFDRLENVREWLPSLAPGVLSRIAANRRRSSGTAIVPIERQSDSGTIRLAFLPEDGEEADMFRQIIFDNWWEWSAIYDLESVSNLAFHQPPEEVFSAALRDAGLRA